MEHSPGQIISWVTNEALVNLRKWKSYQVSFPIRKRLDIRLGINYRKRLDIRRDINYRKKSVKNTNTWRLNNTVLDNQEITEEIKEEIKKYLETSDSENMTTQNLQDAAKAVLRGKFIAIQSYLKKEETSKINNLTLHLKQLEKEEQKNPKVSRRKEIIKIRSEISEKEMQEMIAKISKTKSWFFEKIKLINLQPDSSRKKGRGCKSIKLEMKKENHD